MQIKNQKNKKIKNMYKYENGIGNPDSVNKMHDGRTINYRSTVKTKDGRVFWLKSGEINNSTGKNMELVESIGGHKYNVNLNNGIAYSTTLR